jgi:hypothetical protein
LRRPFNWRANRNRFRKIDFLHSPTNATVRA